MGWLLSHPIRWDESRPHCVQGTGILSVSGMSGVHSGEEFFMAKAKTVPGKRKPDVQPKKKPAKRKKAREKLVARLDEGPLF